MKRHLKLAGALAASLALIGAPAPSFAGVFVGVNFGVGIGISVDVAPPQIPVYEQPPVVVADQIWTPGYWAYGAYGYYWVPGAWVAPPQPGYLWTPGYWAFAGTAYGWHPGYWGPHVGFYGGVNYGCGYNGFGYVGGGWFGGHFRYNTAVTNVNTAYIRNVYVDRTVINNDTTIERVSYNGGPHGIFARPTPQELAYRSERRFPATFEQQRYIEAAAHDRRYLASVNGGHPARAAFAAPHGFANFGRPGLGFRQANAYHAQGYRPVSTYRAAEFRAPAFHQPAYRAPAYHAAYRAPAYRAPVYRVSTYRAPTFHAYHAPAYHAPAYHAPTYHAPAYHAPAYHATSTFRAAVRTAPRAPHAESFHRGR